MGTIDDTVRIKRLGRLAITLALVLLAVTAFHVHHAPPLGMPASATEATGGPSEATLLAADDDSADWILPGRGYDGNRYVHASQLTRHNVGRLRLAWQFHYPDPTTIEAAPLVWHATVFVTSGNDSVYALDARTGEVRWNYRYAFARAVGIRANRGVALLDGRVYLGTVDGHLVALDAATGRVAWNKRVAFDLAHSYLAIAPVPYKHLILVSPSTGVWGGAGSISAYSAATGTRVWTWYTIPRRGQAGHETWGPGDAWKTGGGSIWGGMAIDPHTDTLFVDVGNPQPVLSGDTRPGRNLYTDSMVALDIGAAQPRVRWYRQFTPHDVHDYDAAAPPVLFNGRVRGTLSNLVAAGDKMGNFWVLNAADGSLVYRLVVALQKNTDVPATPAGVFTCPGTNGGVQFNGGSYLPETNAFYVPSLDQCEIFYGGPATQQQQHGLDLGAPAPRITGPSSGWVNAVDIGTGHFLWRDKLPLPENGGALSFGTGLVFSGQLDGEFDAYDARTGIRLWHDATGSSISSPPSAYTLDGRQYVIVGAGIPTENFALPGVPGATTGATISAFALP